MPRIPLRPGSPREVNLLEAALIASALLDPAIERLILDPLEGANWLEALATAAKAKALEAAGLAPEEIARETGHSRTLIEAHLSGRSIAGRLVAEALERLKKGELPDPLALHRCPKRLEELRAENEELLERIARLEEARECMDKLRELHDRARELEERLAATEGELRRCRDRLEEARRLLCGAASQNQQ